MKTTITTYDSNGNEIVSRNYEFHLTDSPEHLAEALGSILEDSQTYLEEQDLDYGDDHRHAGKIDADGVCLECGKENLI